MIWALGAAFLLTPLVEIYLLIQVGQVIGAWPTVALLLGVSLLGAWVVRREGRRAWAELRAAMAGLQLPDRQLADGALVLIGGTLLLTPGFLTDALGFLLVLPPTRALARRLLLAHLARRLEARVRTVGAAGGPFAVPGWPGATRRPAAGGKVVPGEVVEPPGDERPDDPQRPPGRERRDPPAPGGPGPEGSS